LPKQCVVLLEDIDTAGLTHSRDDKSQNSEEAAPVAALPGVSPSLANNSNNRISLSGLLNVLDGATVSLLSPSATPVGVTIRPSIKPASELTPIQVKLLAEEKAAGATATLALKKIEEAKVEKLGEDFAAFIPTLTFSPAEIQGYLLKHKRDPEGAVRGASAWAEKTKAEKNKKATEEKEKEDKERLEKERTEGWNLTNLWG
ncbi:hypothetical protein IFR05_017236, partial [Cadophora sp. M221]